jgi:hypothetical protein
MKLDLNMPKNMHDIVDIHVLLVLVSIYLKILRAIFNNSSSAVLIPVMDINIAGHSY